jgi:L-fuconolactonase
MADLYRFDWLASGAEPAIDGTRAIVDPHHHLWRAPGKDFAVPELLAETTASHNVTRTVFVECSTAYRVDGPAHMRVVGETEFVAAAAAETDGAGKTVIAGIVSHADMMLGDAVEEVLVAHQVAGAGRFRGIRHATSYDPDPAIRSGHSKPRPNMMAETPFVAGVATLGRLGHTFDAWIFHPQITELAALARAVPGTTMILDHLGGPIGIGSYSDRRDEVFEAWKPAITEAATCPNIFLKLGGIGMEWYFGMGWHARPEPPGSEEVASYWGDWLRYAIDAFGPDRCMFESNFPVDRAALPYSVLWNAFQIVAADYTDEEQAALFSGTAERVYRLD